MRSFQRTQTIDPVPGDVVAMLRRIDFSAGSEARYADQVPQLLDALREPDVRPGRVSTVPTP